MVSPWKAPQSFCEDQMSQWWESCFAICGALNNGNELYAKGLGPCGWGGRAGLGGRGSACGCRVAGGAAQRGQAAAGQGEPHWLRAAPRLFTAHHRSSSCFVPILHSSRRCWPLPLCSGPTVLGIVFWSLSFSVDTADSWQLNQQLVGGFCGHLLASELGTEG